MNGRWVDALLRANGTSAAVRDDTDQISYEDLVDQSQQTGLELSTRYGTDQMLVVRTAPTIAFVRTLLGVMWSGNVPVPIDPALPARAVDEIVERSRAAAVLDPLAAPAGLSKRIDRYDSSRPAIVMFTSGTSGVPKGVLVSDANLMYSCATIADYLGYRDEPSAAVVLPLHYSYALISQVLSQLSIGGRVRLFNDLRNPIKFADTVTAEGIQTFCGVPSTYHSMATVHAMRPIALPSIRVLCSAGAAMDGTVWATVHQMFPNARRFNNYGMTEASPRIAFIRDDDPRFGEPTCGHPMAGVEVRIVDPETEQELADGSPGMLVVRGPNLTSGYLNDEDQTRRAFTAEGFLKSGDLAYLDAGYIFIMGRIDDVFNCGGEKIAPLEIERALNDCPGVALSAVTSVSDPQRGAVPVAFVQTTGDVSRAEIVAFLGQRLSKSKLPLRYIRVTDFPMTANGKLQRNRLSADDECFVIGELR